VPRTQDVIATAINRCEAEVPQLSRLKLVVRLELRGRGDVQVFRVRMPGPEITKGEPNDSRIQIAINRADFNELAESGTIKDWREAYETGHVRIVGDSRIKSLVGSLIDREEARRRVRKVH
jgi:hypothetical protein